MFNSIIHHVRLCLAGLLLIASAPGGPAQTHPAWPTSPTLALVAAPTSLKNQWETAESHTQHAARTNHNLMTAAAAILTLFVLGRLALLWQIARNRKKHARENSLEIQP